MGNRFHAAMYEICRIIELRQEIEERKKKALSCLTAAEYLGEEMPSEEELRQCFDKNLRLLDHPEWRYDYLSFNVGKLSFVPPACGDRIPLGIFKGLRNLLKSGFNSTT